MKWIPKWMTPPDTQSRSGAKAATHWNEQKIRKMFSHCDDVQFQYYQFGNPPVQSAVLFVFCEVMTGEKMINEMVLPSLQDLHALTHFRSVEQIQREKKLELSEENDSSDADLAGKVFEGKLLIYFVDNSSLFSVDVAKIPDRQPEESNAEVSIRGPKDGFVENISVNLALIRKRIRSNSLAYEKYIIGTRTMTKVGLLYIQDVINPQLLEEARKRLTSMNIAGLYSTTQLESMIADSSFSIFPLMGYTGRPDFVVECLMNGRFVVLVDGNPSAVIAPSDLMLQLKTPEDTHFTFLNVAFGRLIRFISLFVTLLLPGFYIALLTFHQDQIPFMLLATITSSRMGIPLPAALEMFLTLALLELFREAGVRLPSAIGQTITVVGGLIIGDAAIRAGLFSPSMIVIGAITAVAGSTLVSQALSGTLNVLRLIILFASSLLGMFGFLFTFFALVLYLANLRSFGVPYLAPLSPPTFRDIPESVLRIPWSLRKKRPQYLKTKNQSKQGEGSS